jgi:hypothetical protein
MGEHIDKRKADRKRKAFESDESARRQRVTFKNYLREMREEELEAELDDLDLTDDDQE